MKQLGNLTLVCARRPEVLLQLYNGQVTVHVGQGPGAQCCARRGMMTRRSAASSMN